MTWPKFLCSLRANPYRRPSSISILFFSTLPIKVTLLIMHSGRIYYHAFLDCTKGANSTEFCCAWGQFLLEAIVVGGHFCWVTVLLGSRFIMGQLSWGPVFLGSTFADGHCCCWLSLLGAIFSGCHFFWGPFLLGARFFWARCAATICAGGHFTGGLLSWGPVYVLVGDCM